ncbi:hypothetical protein EYW47_14785 [Paraburkholderia silviterrae]|uniref:Uncharacterized protein n=1 Tax=Paraburkholderia silviterrae TaxID=2528715 RepID=A0A4R5M9B2_9BURK|nr:hypothetical protein EYW47_14785 [Paraburkholderia silviterrae]
MKTTFLMSAALVGVVSLVSAVQAQDMSGQQNAQPVSGATSASTNTSPNASPGTSGYGGVSGSNSASGSLTRLGWATCGHMPQCNPDSGH